MSGDKDSKSVMEDVVSDVERSLDKKNKNKNTKADNQANYVQVLNVTEQFLVEYQYVDGQGENDSVMVRTDRGGIPDVLRYIEENINQYTDESEEFNNENMHIYRLGNEVKVKGYHVEIEDL